MVIPSGVQGVVFVIASEPVREEVAQRGRAPKPEHAAVELGKGIRYSRQRTVVALEKLVAREIESPEQLQHVRDVTDDARVRIEVKESLEWAQSHEDLVAEAECRIAHEDELVPKDRVARLVRDQADGDERVGLPQLHCRLPRLVDVAP